jgi:hypothetical protein
MNDFFLTRYVICDLFTEEDVVFFSDSDYHWDSGVAYDEFDESALFKTEEEADEALRKIQDDFINSGTPSSELDFTILEINLLHGIAAEIRKEMVSIYGSSLTEYSADVDMAIAIVKLLRKKKIL